MEQGASQTTKWSVAGAGEVVGSSASPLLADDHD